MIKYFFFFLLFLFSCKSQKIISMKVPNEVLIDTFEFSSGEFIDDKPMPKIEASPNKMDELIENTDKKKEKKSKKIESKKENKTLYTNIDSNVNGVLSYSIPVKMIVGTEYVIRLRISKDKNVDIVAGDRGISINDTSIQSNIFIESVKVEPIMSADLVSDKDVFDITRTSSDIQNINDGYTEWSWIIIPLKSGENYLKLVVKVKSEGINKDITVFDKKIKVKSDIVFSLKNFLNQYWQWIMSTIIIPIIIWVYKNKK